MEIAAYQMRNVLWIPVPEELDHAMAEKIRRKCDMICIGQTYRHLVFDFSETEFMDSAGIGMLMGRYQQMKAGGGKLFIYKAGKRILRMLEISGLIPYLYLCDTMAQINAKLEEKEWRI